MDAAPAGGRCSRSVGTGPRPASFSGQQPQEEVDPVLVTIIQLRRRHHRPLSINPCLRGVLRGWRPPGRGEGMEPARDAPCPRPGPAGGSADQQHGGARPRGSACGGAGAPWALRQVPARSRGAAPARRVTNGGPYLPSAPQALPSQSWEGAEQLARPWSRKRRLVLHRV